MAIEDQVKDEFKNNFTQRGFKGELINRLDTRKDNNSSDSVSLLNLSYKMSVEKLF